jgi:hypothetical protein
LCLEEEKNPITAKHFHDVDQTAANHEINLLVPKLFQRDADDEEE